MMKGQLRKIGLTIGVLVVAIISLASVDSASAATQTVSIFPNSDNSPTQWNQRSGGEDFYGRIFRTSESSGSWICSASNSATSVFGVGSRNVNDPSAPPINVQQGATQVTVTAGGRVAAHLAALNSPNISIGVLIPGFAETSSSSSWITALPAFTSSSCTSSSNVWGYDTIFYDTRQSTSHTRNATVGSEWTQSQVNGMEFKLQRSGSSSNRAVRVHHMHGILTYVTYSTLTQNGYQFYKPVNTPDPDSADIIAPTAASTPKAHNYNAGNDDNSRKFRLRMAVRTTDERWLRQYGQYRLQYGFKPANGQCSDVPSWYTVNNDTGSIQYSPIAGLADGTTIGPAAQDPNPGGAAAHQMHVNSSLLVAGGWQDPFVKRTEVPLNGHAIWDFALVYTGNASDQTFCFRIVNADGNTQPIDVYADYPEIRLLDGSTSVDIVDTGGASVSEPSVLFDSLTGILNCTPNSAMLGTSGQRIRVRDNRAADAQNWSLSIAPTAAAWTGSDNPGNTYPYNNAANAGCAGQLALHTGGAGVAASSGCNAANVQMPGGAFTGATPLTLASLPNSNDVGMGCYWDITGIELEQQVPGGTLPDTYSLPMTITMMAQ